MYLDNIAWDWNFEVTYQLQHWTKLASNLDIHVSPQVWNVLHHHFGEHNGNPVQFSCLKTPMDGGVWQAAVHGVEKSQNTTEWLHFHFSLSCIGGGNGNPLQCSCLENPRDGEAWWAAVYGVAQSRTWLKRLSNSSSSIPSFPYINILPHYLSFPSGTPLIHTLFLLIVSHWFLHSFSFLFFVSLIV